MKFRKAAAIAVALTMTSFGYQPVEAAPMRMAPIAGAAQFGQMGDVVEVQRRVRRRRGRGRRRGFRRGVGAGVAGALIGGAIIGGVIAEERRRDRRRYRRARRADRHVDWCYNRFNSYREWDNTYLAFSGRRRECRSPYY